MAATLLEIEELLGTKMIGCGYIYYVYKLSNGETTTIDYNDAMRLYPNSYTKTWRARSVHSLDEAIWNVDKILMHNNSGDMLVKWHKEENEHYQDTWIDARELVNHAPESVWYYLNTTKEILQSNGLFLSNGILLIYLKNFLYISIIVWL